MAQEDPNESELEKRKKIEERLARFERQLKDSNYKVNPDYPDRIAHARKAIQEGMKDVFVSDGQIVIGQSVEYFKKIDFHEWNRVMNPDTSNLSAIISLDENDIAKAADFFKKMDFEELSKYLRPDWAKLLKKKGIVK